MDFQAALNSFGALHQHFGPILDTALLVFIRCLSFMFFGPIFNRKNLPVVVKIIAAIYFTSTLLWLVPVDKHGSFHEGDHAHFILQIVSNITIGALIGFIANMILQAAYSAGSLMNNQIGLSSANIMDPSTGKNAMLLEPLFSLLTILLFIHLGGVHWMILALKKSFTVFPLYQINQPITEVIQLDYLILVSSNVITVAVQFMAPILVVTMSVDLILGIVNRAAQQMPVFQLSFALKPAIGAAVLLVTLPIFLETLTQYLNDYAGIF